MLEIAELFDRCEMGELHTGSVTSPREMYVIWAAHLECQRYLSPFTRKIELRGLFLPY